MLQLFAETARAQLQDCDLLGRLGGEEFAAVVYNIDGEEAFDLAELIRSSFVEAATEVDGYPIGATLSIGIVLAHAAPLDISELLAQADQALYYAKERGRNRVEVATLDLVRDGRGAATSQAKAIPARTAA